MLPLRKILATSQSSYVNFTNPFNGRKWLQLLRPDLRYGITFIPNLNLPAKKLGFSFCSNKLGLRGPSSTNADGVVLGTSFAMGLSVNNESNWYDLLMEPGAWFNGAMPVGPSNHINLLDDLYTGPAKTLIYLYHPNLWVTAQHYVDSAANGDTIFDFLHWRLGFFDAVKLYPHWLFKEFVKSFLGYSIFLRWDGEDFNFNTRYSFFDLEKSLEFAQSQMDLLNVCFAKFERVIVIRTPIKEDSLAASLASPLLIELRANYESMWQLFKSQVDAQTHCYSLDHGLFTGKHFHPFDTHWSTAGNSLFVKLIKPILASEHVPGLLKGAE